MTTNNDNDLIINSSLHDMKNCVTSRSLAFDLSISISEAQTIIDRRVNEKHCHRYEVTRCQRFDDHDDGKIVFKLCTTTTTTTTSIDGKEDNSNNCSSDDKKGNDATVGTTACVLSKGTIYGLALVDSKNDATKVRSAHALTECYLMDAMKEGGNGCCSSTVALERVVAVLDPSLAATSVLPSTTVVLTDREQVAVTVNKAHTSSLPSSSSHGQLRKRKEAGNRRNVTTASSFFGAGSKKEIGKKKKESVSDDNNNCIESNDNDSKRKNNETQTQEDEEKETIDPPKKRKLDLKKIKKDKLTMDGAKTTRAGVKAKRAANNDDSSATSNMSTGEKQMSSIRTSSNAALRRTKKSSSSTTSAKVIKSTKAGNVNDFIGDIDEDEEFEHEEDERKKRNASAAKLIDKEKQRNLKAKKMNGRERRDAAAMEKEEENTVTRDDKKIIVNGDDAEDIDSGERESSEEAGLFGSKQQRIKMLNSNDNDNSSKNRRCRVLEEKTFVDENGYLKTETISVWKEVEQNDNNVQGDGDCSNNGKGGTSGKKEIVGGKGLPVSKSGLGASKKKSMKQVGLMGFFSKK